MKKLAKGCLLRSPMIRRHGLSTLIVILMTLAPPVVAQPTSDLDPATLKLQQEQSRKWVEELREQRRAQAVPTDIVTPFYSVTGSDETDLYILNNISDPVRVEVAAFDPRGRVLPLGSYDVGPARHLFLPLREAIRAGGPGFHRGSLRISFLGDDETVQAWAVLRRGRQVVELAFESASASSGNELLTFWEASTAPAAAPVFFVLNAGNRPLTYAVETGLGKKEAGATGRTLNPGQSHRFSPGGVGKQWLRITHDGELGALRMVGLRFSRNILAKLPVMTPAVWQNTLAFNAIRVPLSHQDSAARPADRFGGRGTAMMTLFNAASSEREALIEVFDPTNGVLLMRRAKRVSAGQVTSVDLSRWIAEVLGRPRDEVRVRVSSPKPGLLVSGSSTLPTGEILDLVFFPQQDAHSTGTYPLPPLETHEVFATLVNLGEEPAEVVAQFYWDKGTYAYGPFRIEAGTSYRIDVAAVAARKEPDLLGRTLDRDYAQGFLKWSVRSGSHALIGRTEARAHDAGRDTFGFNCIGCCFEEPRGDVLPFSTSFFVGQSPSFQACYYVDTCNSTLGPFLSSPTSYDVPSPFSWNGLNISASAAGQEDVWFFDTEEGKLPGTLCPEVTMPVAGRGKPSSCKTLLRKAHNPSQSWSPGGSTCAVQVGSEPANKKCERCNACCHAIYAYNICRKVLPALAAAERNACLIHCITDLGCN